jgi:hypothetical protein
MPSLQDICAMTKWYIFSFWRLWMVCAKWINVGVFHQQVNNIEHPHCHWPWPWHLTKQLVRNQP